MERILATYRITASESESRVRAEALAAEQSVEMPVAAIGDDRVLEEVVATVESIRPHAGYFDVVLGIAQSTTGAEPSQLMNMLFGNCSLQPEVELVDVKVPAAFTGEIFNCVGEKAYPVPALAAGTYAFSCQVHPNMTGTIVVQ